jgi:hypothetical protein
MLKPLNFRYALVIEEIDSVRTSIVNVLRAQGWLVHGIPRAEQAFQILAHIPYNLVGAILGPSRLALGVDPDSVSDPDLCAGLEGGVHMGRR